MIKVEIKNEDLRRFVIDDMHWKMDLPAFIKEVATCTQGGAYLATFEILKRLLQILVERVKEIDDPVLHLIMIDLCLYEGCHDPSMTAIKKKLRDYLTENKLY